jgi:hypothetical protein
MTPVCARSRTHLATFAVAATADPALIPHEPAVRTRSLPRIPATTASESPAHPGNPRLSPLRPEAP